MGMEKDFRQLQENGNNIVKKYIATLKKCLELNRIMHNWDDVEALEYAIKRLKDEKSQKN